MGNNVINIAAWNTGGWHGSNQLPREEILYRLAADIVFLSETKTSHEEHVSLMGYCTFSHNRVKIHKLATHGSGGTAFLVKQDLFNTYDIEPILCEIDGIIGLKLKDKFTEFETAIIGSYLPPESSTHLDDPDEYFQYLVGMIYELYDLDLIIMCGDYNARIGSKKDYVETIDDIPSRQVVDTVSNDHGQSLINFCL